VPHHAINDRANNLMADSKLSHKLVQSDASFSFSNGKAQTSYFHSQPFIVKFNTPAPTSAHNVLPNGRL
jgi:hypothetical protein